MILSEKLDYGTLFGIQDKELFFRWLKINKLYKKSQNLKYLKRRNTTNTRRNQNGANIGPISNSLILEPTQVGLR